MFKTVLLLFILIHSCIVLSQNNTFNINDLKSISKNKQTVCSLTVNSKDEILYLQKRLDKTKYQFVELIPDTNQIKGGLDFLKRSCHILKKNNVQCDQLILSTHFGNHYWGESGVRFNIKELEELSCSHVCDNVLSAPKTKLAFACNMNAELEQTSRTPEQMRSDLIRDGLSSRDADLAVQSVNGVNGMSYKARHSFIFSGGGDLIGFDRRSPSGPVLSNLLDQFFNHGGQWSTSKSDFLMPLNQINRNLGLTINSSKFDQNLKLKLCSVINPDTASSKKMLYFSEWLDHQDGFYLFSRFVDFVTQKHFFSELNNYDLQNLAKISQKQDLKNKVLSSLFSIKGPTIKHRWAFVAWKLKWISSEKFLDIVTESIVRFLRPPFPKNQSDRQDVIDEIGWMNERYIYYNKKSVQKTVLSQIRFDDLKRHLGHKTIRHFLGQDFEIMQAVFLIIDPEDSVLKQTLVDFNR